MLPTGDRKLLKIERHYQRIFAHLNPSSLSTCDGPEVDWPGGHALAPASDEHAHELFLNYYGREGLRAALEEYGLFDQIRKLHLGEPTLTFDRFENSYDVMHIHGTQSAHPLVEVISKVGALPAEIHEPEGLAGRSFLHVKWLRMQNPLVPPPQNKPLLPGQGFPSLGLGREMMALLQMMASRLDLDGVVELPERLHNAVLYFTRFRFLDPELQGQLTAILRDTRERNLSDLAWGMECGGLQDLTTGKPFRWLPKEQVLPRTGPVVGWLNSAAYRERAKAAMGSHHFLLTSGDIATEMAAAQCKDAAAVENPFPAKIK